VSKVFQVCAVLAKEDDFVSRYGKTKERLIRSRPWRPIRVRRVVPGRGMSSQARSHDPNRSSGNKTSEDEEAKNLRIKRLAYKTAIQRGKRRWTQQSEQIVQATSRSVACTSSSSVSRATVVHVVMRRWRYICGTFEAAERLCTRRHVQFAAREDSILGNSADTFVTDAKWTHPKHPDCTCRQRLTMPTCVFTIADRISQETQIFRLEAHT